MTADRVIAYSRSRMLYSKGRDERGTMVSEARRRAMRRYTAKMVSYIVRMRPDKDADIIAHLGGITNKTAYIRALIRADIGAKKKAEE